MVECLGQVVHFRPGFEYAKAHEQIFATVHTLWESYMIIGVKVSCNQFVAATAVQAACEQVDNDLPRFG